MITNNNDNINNENINNENNTTRSTRYLSGDGATTGGAVGQVLRVLGLIGVVHGDLLHLVQPQLTQQLVELIRRLVGLHHPQPSEAKVVEVVPFAPLTPLRNVDKHQSTL